MSRPNSVMNHLPSNDDITVKMFNLYLKEKDPQGRCDEFANQFNQCVKKHYGDFRYCGTSYLHLLKCIHNVQ